MTVKSWREQKGNHREKDKKRGLVAGYNPVITGERRQTRNEEWRDPGTKERKEY